MSNKLLIIYICAGLVVLAGAICLGQKAQEPSYAGKPLNLWLRDYDLDRPAWEAADQAIIAMGTNAVPFLLEAHVENDPKWKRWLAAKVLSNKAQLRREERKDIRREEVEHAFFALRQRSSDVVPMLIAMYDDPNWAHRENRRHEILFELGRAGPSARKSVPLLLRETQSTNAYLRLDAFWALGMVHSQAESVVPVLIRGLNDNNVRVREAAATGLKQFGAQAKSAIPALAKLEEEETERATTWPSPIDDRVAQAAARNALIGISNATESLPFLTNPPVQTNAPNRL